MLLALPQEKVKSADDETLTRVLSTWANIYFTSILVCSLSSTILPTKGGGVKELRHQRLVNGN